MFIVRRGERVLAATQREAIAGLTVQYLDGGPTMVLATMNLPHNSVGDARKGGPLYDRRLLGKMVAVVATDVNDEIAVFFEWLWRRDVLVYGGARGGYYDDGAVFLWRYPLWLLASGERDFVFGAACVGGTGGFA